MKYSLVHQCYQGFNDKRYYVPAFVLSKQLDSVFKINFLVDTGSPTTLLSGMNYPMPHLGQIYEKIEYILEWVGVLKRSFCPNAVCFFMQILAYMIQLLAILVSQTISLSMADYVHPSLVFWELIFSTNLVFHFQMI